MTDRTNEPLVVAHETARPNNSPASDAEIGEMVAIQRRLLAAEDPMHPIGCEVWIQEVLYTLEISADLLTRLSEDKARLEGELRLSERSLHASRSIAKNQTARADKAEAERDALKVQIEDIKSVADARLEDRSTAAENAAEVVAALQADLSALKAIFAELEPITKSVSPGPEPHTLTMQDGTKQTGPAVDALVSVLDVVKDACRRAAELHATLMQKDRAR